MMRIFLAAVLSSLVFASMAFADEKADADMAARIAAAQAKLAAKKAAASTQPTASPTTRPVQANVDRFAEQRKAHVAALLQDIASVKKSVADDKKNKPLISFGPLDPDGRIKDDQNELRQIQSHPLAWVPPIKDEVGSVGCFSDQVKVLQILDSQNMLALECYTYNGSSGEKDTPIWISGVDTSSLNDGKYLELPGVFDVTGNKTYTTPNGATSTVLVLKREN